MLTTSTSSGQHLTAIQVLCSPRASVPEDELLKVHQLRTAQMVWKSRTDWGTNDDLWGARVVKCVEFTSPLEACIELTFPAVPRQT